MSIANADPDVRRETLRALRACCFKLVSGPEREALDAARDEQLLTPRQVEHLRSLEIEFASGIAAFIQKRRHLRPVLPVDMPAGAVI